MPATWVLVAARQWRQGFNPYTTAVNPGLYLSGLPTPSFYPFTAVLAALPFSFLPDPIAVVAWVSIIVGLMTYAITQDGWWRLPILGSLPLIASILQVQWAPLMLCMWMYPALLPIASLKPNLGLALATRKITRAGIIAAFAFLLFSLVLFPLWPWYWLGTAKQATHLIPLLFWPGPFLVLALIRWKKPESRLLLVMACVPQVMYFYDGKSYRGDGAQRGEGPGVILP